jgi:MFS family permease
VPSSFFPNGTFHRTLASPSLCDYKIYIRYTRKELGVRTAILFCGSLSSNAFGGLVAAGILDGMEGTLGHAAWRWLFYVEGAATVVVAIIAAFVLPDFPSTTKWLTPAERRLAELRMEEDAGIVDEVSVPSILLNYPSSFFGDRRTRMDLFGAGSGWQLVTGKHGGCVSGEYLK